jgi:3'-phosphoadenosine 5'-phosphosulfate sulfotransferase (PAPS reductase)/FAD synthetase
MRQQALALQTGAETWDAERVLHWAFDAFGKNVAIASAFGAEGMVLIDIASRIRRDFRLFTLDTDFLFPETYTLMDQVEQRYGIAFPGRTRTHSRKIAVAARARSMLQFEKGGTAAA